MKILKSPGALLIMQQVSDSSFCGGSAAVGQNCLEERVRKQNLERKITCRLTLRDIASQSGTIDM